jgi:transketolase
MADKLMKAVFVDFMREEMRRDEKRVFLDADLSKCIGSACLYAEFPDRTFDVGIAEANMAGMAAGLSAYGYKPVITSFAPFATRRMLDQIVISIAYSRQNCVIVGTDPGICAELNGGTHMPFEDIGALRSIPDITIYEPTDIIELQAVLPEIMAKTGVIYIRLNRKTPPVVYAGKEDKEFSLTKADVMREGKDVSIIASGIMVSTALEAADELLKAGVSAEVVCCHTVKPIDAATIVASAKKTGAVATAENHNVIGALNSAVCETLCANYPVPVKCVGVKEKFGEVGKMPYLRKVYNMETADVVRAALEAVAMKK